MAIGYFQLTCMCVFWDPGWKVRGGTAFHAGGTRFQPHLAARFLDVIRIFVLLCSFLKFFSNFTFTLFNFLAFKKVLSSGPFPTYLLYFWKGSESASCNRPLVTPWTVASQALMSMEFSSQVYQSGFPVPSPGDHPDPGIKPGSLALQVDSLLSKPLGKPCTPVGHVE